VLEIQSAKLGASNVPMCRFQCAQQVGEFNTRQFLKLELRMIHLAQQLHYVIIPGKDTAHFSE